MIILYVPKDGNCMFSCLASFFNKSDIDHVLLRQMIVHYILHNQSKFEMDVKAEGFDSVDHYCQNMLRMGFWGDGTCLQAFSLIFKINVYICDVKNQERVMRLTDVGNNRPNIALLFDEDHYDRILSWRMFVEVDGMINESDSLGLGSTLANLMPSMSNSKNANKASYSSCQKWVKAEFINEISFEEHDFEIYRYMKEISRKPKEPAERRDEERLPRPIEEFFDPPPHIPRLPMLRAERPPIIEYDIEEEEVVVFAPRGFWIVCVMSNNRFKYHVKDESAIQCLLRKRNNTSEIAEAIYRLADEIALKPAEESGSEVQNAMKHFYGISE